jgi:hypothetical protein
VPTSRVSELDAILEKIEGEIQTTASSQEMRQLRAIVRRPGWRTAAEQSLFLAMAATLSDHLQAGARMRKALLDASKQISPIPASNRRPA